MIKVIFGRVGYRVNKELINNIVRKSNRAERKITGVVEVNIISDKEMRRLNSVWRKKEKTTDVLSFAWDEEKKVGGNLLGQIFISYPQVKKQASVAKVAVTEEFVRVLVHGLLHLAGYDHKKPSQAKKMFKMQDKIIKLTICLSEGSVKA